MMRKVAHLVTDNIALKALAFILAVALWMVVVNVDDPKITRNFTTTVTSENESYLKDMGKYYVIDESEYQVTFTVSGKRSYLEKMNGSDFKATANFENIEDFQKIPVDIVAQRYSNYVSVSSKTKYLEVYVENLTSQPFVVSVKTEGTVAEGKALGETSVSPSILRVTGPESVVSTIDKVVASVTVGGMSGDMSDSVVPLLYNEAGDVIDSSALTYNVQNILVGVKVLDTKDVPISVANSSNVGNDYIFTGVTAEPDHVFVKGESAALRKLDGIRITTDTDLTTVTKSFTEFVDISEALPGDVELLNQDDAEVVVKYNIEEKSSLEIEVPVEDIQVTGLPIGRKVEFADESIVITFRGRESDIKELDIDTVKGTLDVSDFSMGTHSVMVAWTYDNEKFEVLENEIQIKIVQNK